jgi:hypothetical protein
MKRWTFATVVVIGGSAIGACDEQAERPPNVLFEAQKGFVNADRNKDGVVTQPEASAIANFDFDAADVDRNAALSPEEFEVAYTHAKSRG